MHILSGIIRSVYDEVRSPNNPFSFRGPRARRFIRRSGKRACRADSDIRNGQDSLSSLPRRYGKSSLVWRASHASSAERVLVAQVDLMTTPSKEGLAAALAKIDLRADRLPAGAGAGESARALPWPSGAAEDQRQSRDGSFSFSFGVAQRPADIDATLERLLELPAELGSARGRPAALVIDEFQEIVAIDPALPKLMRSVFQRQPEVAHVYLGSKQPHHGADLQ